MVFIQASHYGFIMATLNLSAHGLLMARLLRAHCPNPLEPEKNGVDHSLYSHLAQKHDITLGDFQHIPSQRSKVSLKYQAETIRETKRPSFCQPFGCSVFLFLVLSSPMWTVEINMDFVHVAPKHHIYWTSLRTQCL